MARYPVTASKTNTPSLTKAKARKKAYKKKYDKRIGESDSERCDKIVKVRPLAGGYRTNGLHRITAECIDTEYQQQDTPEQLQIEDILVDIIEYELIP